MDGSVLWRAAAFQLATVAALSVLLALALPRSFFDDWGWITGPAAWLLCAVLTARLLDLPPETIVHTGHGESTTVGREAPDLEEWLRRGS